MKRKNDGTMYVPVRSKYARKARPAKLNYTRAGGLTVRPITLVKGSGIEKKTIDVDPATYVADTTGTVTLLNGVATGTDYTNRVGRKINMKSIYIRGHVYPTDSNVFANLARLIIVYDNQPNGVAPTISEVLKSVNATSQTNLDNRDRFNIIMDKQFAIGGISDTATQAFAMAPNVFPIKKYKKLNLESVYSGTGSTVASITSGSLYAITIGTATTGQGSTFQLSYRTRFTDL